MQLRNLSAPKSAQISRPKVKKPALYVGQKIGKLTITKHHGWQLANPDTGKEHNRASHWYWCRCDCGQIEAIPQSALARKDKARTCCKECAKDEALKTKRENAAKKNQAKELPDSVPDFRYMKF